MRARGLVATRGIEPRRGAWELCRAKYIDAAGDGKEECGTLFERRTDS